ncbi:GAS2-like protein 2A [Hemicordylus capensis]|uniref:GAS2-like protein 2A n=1 Tax=Hemicordylus capensis TaxID=884348 RepID=UPI0023020FEA|nr:GAS2-like protein 2A [Hemicordylus capensis]
MSGIPEAPMKSIRPYKSSEQYLYAMKEDLAEWLKDHYAWDVDVGSFLEALQTGVLLCHHANHITQVARDFGQAYPSRAHRVQLPTRAVACNELAQAGTFQARDNVSNFIQWCRKEMDIKEVLMFETEDLVLRKNEKNFVLCLLEVARRASRFGMSAPTLIQMEEEIEEEIRAELDLPREETPLPKRQRKAGGFKNLDQIVQHLVSCCTCPVQFSMMKVSEGKYRVGDSNTLIFVRILRNHVMVRVGGGWDTLEHYLDKHDPCRCTSLSHKQALTSASPQRAQAAPVQHEITARLTPRTDNPNQPQPALIVSRSQSPLPPVEWRTYMPHRLGTRQKALASCPPERSGGGHGRKSLEGPPDHPGLRRDPSGRVRARSVTPSRRLLATEDGPGSQPTIPAQSGRPRTPCVLLNAQQNGHIDHGVHLKVLPEPPRGRTPARIPATAFPRERTERPGTPGIPARREGVHQERKGALPSRSPSPTKYFRPSISQEAPRTPTDSSGMPPERVTPHSCVQNPAVKQAPSPVTNTRQVYKDDTDAKTAGKAATTSYRPHTPSKSYRGELCFRNGGPTLAKGPTIPRYDTASHRNRTVRLEAASGRCAETAGLKRGGLDLGHKRKDIPGRYDLPGSKVTPGELGAEKERVYTPLPINTAEEQALYRSLEDEILSNIRELEADSEEDSFAREKLWGGFRTHCSLEKDPDGNGPQLLTSGLTSLQGAPKGLVYGKGVPRSGVYVPAREARWHPAGLGYDSVIQELSKTLHQERREAETHSPRLDSNLANGDPVEKKVPEKEEAPEQEFTATEDDEAPNATNKRPTEPDKNGEASQETPSETTNSLESTRTLEEPQMPPRKPRRSLKKPERVPSIYKLKLRPKIRPRRDNRPEKRPSKIPTPVAYRHTQWAKGQAKAHGSKRLAQTHVVSPEPISTGNVGSEEEVTLPEYSPSSTQEGDSGKKTATSERSDSEESWL